MVVKVWSRRRRSRRKAAIWKVFQHLPSCCTIAKPIGKRRQIKFKRKIYKGRCNYLNALKFQRKSVRISEITHVPRTCGHCWRHHWLFAHFFVWFQTEDLKEVLNLVDRTFEIVFLNSNVILLPWSVTPWPLKVGGQVKWSPKVIDWFESIRLSLTLPPDGFMHFKCTILNWSWKKYCASS